LILARSSALAVDDSSPTAAAAREAANRSLALEPPLLELVTAATYRVLGGERLWVGRFLSAISWIVAGFFIFLLGRRFGGDLGGITAMAVFLLSPYAVVASRSFQPDPTMVGLIVLSLWWIWRYEENPSPTNLIAAGITTSIAALLKPTAWIFTILPLVALVMTDERAPMRQRVRSTVLYAAIALSLPLLYYVPAFFSGSDLTTQARGSFSLQPLVTASFWRGWVMLLERLPGFVILIAGLTGLVVSPPGRIRQFLFALWCGYPILGLLFTYHIHTHDYYGLPILVAASLSISILAGRITSVARKVWPERTGTLLLVGILSLAVLLAAGSVIARVTAIGDLPIVTTWLDAGRVVGHSSRSIFLARWYGKPLQYHGQLAGFSWPTQNDYHLAAQAGAPLEEPDKALLRLITEEGAEYFIVTDLDEFEKHDELVRLLFRFPLRAASNELLVFDLRRSVSGQIPIPPQ
jgi:4-amino-4-deoxy-L-arabinose transferase-like glycosyltransferase